MKLRIRTDGACSGNPGQMGIGIVIFKDGHIIKRISRAAGFGTNNRAEYLAIIQALREALKLGADSVEIVSDSELAIRQINGLYKVKSEDIMRLKQKVEALSKMFRSARFEWAGRSSNSDADGLAKIAIKNSEC